MKTIALTLLLPLFLAGCNTLPPVDTLPEIGVSPQLALAMIEPEDRDGRTPIRYGSRPLNIRFGWEAWILPRDLTPVDRRLAATNYPNRLIDGFALSGPQRAAMFDRWRRLRIQMQ